MTKNDSGRSVQERLVALEESMMHADRMVSELNEVVRATNERLDGLMRGMRQLNQSVQTLAEQDDEERTLEDEKPPHY